MKNLIAATALIFAVSAPVCAAENMTEGTPVVEPGPVSLGLGFHLGGVFSDYAGPSIGIRLDDAMWLDFLIGPTFGEITNVLVIEADFQIRIGDGFDTGSGPLDPYIGAGVLAQLIDIERIGLRIPAGMRYTLADVPVEFFVEGVPTVTFWRDIGFFIGGELGIRYRF